MFKIISIKFIIFKIFITISYYLIHLVHSCGKIRIFYPTRDLIFVKNLDSNYVKYQIKREFLPFTFSNVIPIWFFSQSLGVL